MAKYFTKNPLRMSSNRRDEMASSADQLERCVLDIGHWTSANRLKLNADKTELLFVISSGHCYAALKGSYPVLNLGADTAVCQGSCVEKEVMQGTMPGARRRGRHARPGWTTSRRGQDSPWKSQSE